MTFVMEIKILIVHLTKNDQYNFCLQSFLHIQALSRESTQFPETVYSHDNFDCN